MNDGDRRISVKDLASWVPPGLAIPVRVSFSPNGRWIAWLRSPERDTNRSLFLHEVETRKTQELSSPAPEVDESTLSQAEKLRRQRTRDLSHGVATYYWSRQDKLIVPTTHGVWAYDPQTEAWASLLDLDTAAIIDPQLSPDGTHLAWVQDNELVISNLVTGNVTPMTEHIGDGVTHGVADFLAQEEMHRMHGFWWSPDSKKIAYTEVDERAVPLFCIPHTSGDPYEIEEQRFPFAGGPNPTTRVFVAGLDGRDHVELDTGGAEYVTNVYWSGDESIITETMGRSQSSVDLARHNIETGARTHLLTDTSEHWVNLHPFFHSLESGSFLWASERTGYMHLEVRNADGSLKTVLTEGDWVVLDVHEVDESAGKVWFSANERGITQRHPYEVSLNGGSLKLLAGEGGTHRIVMDPHRRYFIDTHDDVSHEPELTLRRLDNHEIERKLFKDMDPRVHALGLEPAVLRTITTSDGETLHVSVQVPEGTGPFPTLVHVYGGPNMETPRVRDTYAMTAELEFQYLRERGVCIVRVDNRGMAARGTTFETPIHHNLGRIEVQDQVDAIDVLAHEGIVDRAHVVIKGASYGGYMSVMCLAQRPDVYKAAIGQSLVSHWDAYDSFYTERYMGLPSQNIAGYENSSLMHHVRGIRGPLLLIHGMLDDNAHFRHMTRLINSLIKNAVPYRLLVYPDERHGPRGLHERAHMREQMLEFVLEQLEVSP